MEIALGLIAISLLVGAGATYPFYRRIERIEKTLGNLIAWIGQSPGNPLGHCGTAELLRMLHDTRNK